MELIKVGNNTYYIKNNTNIGIYKVDDKNIYLIDTGNDKDAGRKILRIIEENNWVIKGIINTHSNADHIGGNKYLQDKFNCPIYTSDIEECFTKYPVLESAFLYGGNPIKDLRTKFLEAKPSNTTNIKELSDGLEYFSLKGHFFDMIGIKTPDNIFFLGDSLFSEETITKYHIFFIYDVKEYLNTLEYLSTLEGKLYIPSHTEATSNIQELIQINKDKIIEVCKFLIDICNNEKIFEEILKEVFDRYNLSMNINQYVLVGSTIRSYLTYLHSEGKLKYVFKNNKMYWSSISN